MSKFNQVVVSAGDRIKTVEQFNAVLKDIALIRERLLIVNQNAST
jgi:hypothetical protein